MNDQLVYKKTTLGESEIKQRSGQLSLLQRRVLILVDGSRAADKLRQMSRVDTTTQVLDELRALGFIEPLGGGAEPVRFDPPEPEHRQPAPEPAPANAAADPEIKEFMINGLRAFTNPVRSKALAVEIDNARTNTELRNLINRWHEAIGDSPEGMLRVDSMRAELLEKFIGKV